MRVHTRGSSFNGRMEMKKDEEKMKI